MMRRSEFLSQSGAAMLSAASGTGSRRFSLGNDAIAMSWFIENGALRVARCEDRLNGASIPTPAELFIVRMKDGSSHPASAFTVELTPAQSSVVMMHAESGLRVVWRALLRPGAHYIRQEATLTTTRSALAIDGVQMIDLRGFGDALVSGTVAGSPIVSGNTFVALEHPFADCEAIYGRVSATLPQRLPLLPGIALAASSVVGVARPGQMRRAFLEYVERERAHPYRTFLHYNSWYDLGYFGRYTADEAIERIHAFGGALHDARGVKLESFLFDDGWDDPNDLWHFNNGFPNGFAPLTKAAAAYGAAPGAWLSPWGGYGVPRDERLASAKRLGYELNDDGLALSGPKYFAYFSDVVENFIRSGVNQFKLDGTGDAGSVYPGSRFGSDFDAAIALVTQMRAQRPDIYVNLTTGTYPSPFWLRYCDSIWRGGYDTDFEGPGTERQRWITYRDADTYAGIVTQGPLFPLNSVMLHGIVYARYAPGLKDDPHGDLCDEIRSYFGTGTQLQELYVTPTLLTNRNWNDLAQSAKWSAANADVLRDTHWIGGNPARLDVYGWAAWSPRKGIVTLRNPNSSAQEFVLDVERALELPENSARRFHARDRYDGGAGVDVRAGRPHVVRLAPFEVLSLDLFPILG